MTEEHNKGKNNGPAPQNKVTGQNRLKADSEKNKNKGNSEEDPREVTKGKNSKS